MKYHSKMSFSMGFVMGQITVNTDRNSKAFQVKSNFDFKILV